MNNAQNPNNFKNGQEPIKTIHIKVDKEDMEKKEALWAEETKHSRKTTIVVVGIFFGIILLSGFIPVLGKLPVVPLLVIYVIIRMRKGKEIKKKNEEEYRRYQEEKYAARVKAESSELNKNFTRSYVTEESYDEYQARKKAEEEEIQMMQEAYDQEQERLQRMEEEWHAQQELFQQIHGDHYDDEY